MTFSILSVPMSSDRATLTAQPRSDFGSRTSRRLRRSGQVPGVVYSDGSEALAFQAAGSDLRVILAEGHALFDIAIEGSDPVPVVIKEQQHHPVRGDLQHIDLQKVRLDRAIEAEVAIELAGADDAPGIKQGGVLEHTLREVTVEALPTEIPDSLSLDVSELEINDSITLDRVVLPEGVTLAVAEPAEVTVATISPPRVEEEPSAAEVEEEVGIVGEEGGDTPAEAESAEESSGEE
jgi:large subunit ribosomal protein L25